MVLPRVSPWLVQTPTHPHTGRLQVGGGLDLHLRVLLMPGLRATTGLAQAHSTGGRHELARAMGHGALEVLFVKPLLGNDPDKSLAFAVTEFSLP